MAKDVPTVLRRILRPGRGDLKTGGSADRGACENAPLIFGVLNVGHQKPKERKGLDEFCNRYFADQ